jgi:pSer/pThr/pTyr-binding forkhead associated (FHA) protein
MGATRRTSNVGAPADDARGGGRAVERNDRANVAATTTDERRESVHPDDGDDLGRSSADANAAGVSETHRGRGVVYAELRRVSKDAPTTKTLPDKIDLPSPERVGDVLTLGRQRVNDVQLDCPRVPSLLSRKHAEITVDANGTHFVTDKDTLNGTYLNGNLIPRGPCPLKPGDIIAFGGPANVLRDNRTLRNSFRYEYRRPLALEAWREACTARERESVGEDGARDAAATATATEPTPGVDDEERRRPTKRTSFRSGDAVSGDAGGGGASVARAGENAAATTRPHSQSTQPTQPTQSTQPTQPTQSTQPTQPTQPTRAPVPEPEAVAKEILVDDGIAPDGYRSPGKACVKLSKRDLVSMRRAATKLSTRSPDFLRDALSETGVSLAESVVPLNPEDGSLMMDIIADASGSDRERLFANVRDVVDAETSGSQGINEVSMTQAPTQEYVAPSELTAATSAAVARMVTQTCHEALELHTSASGLVSFGLKLLNATSVWDSETYNHMEKTAAAGGFKRGDLVAESIALALYPKEQMGWERTKKEDGDDTPSDNRVFAASVGEIDGHGSDIGAAGCEAIAEAALTPRRSSDGRWIFNECLRSLTLGKNPRVGDAGCSAIAKALAPRPVRSSFMFNTTLTVLDLSSCGIGSAGADALVDALKMVPVEDDWIFPSNIRALKLSGNQIGAKGAKGIASLLGPKNNMKSGSWSFNPSLALIDLSDNPGLDDSVAEAFVQALKPRKQKSQKRERGDAIAKPSFAINLTLSKLRLCGHAFHDGVKKITDSLDAKNNGSDGAAKASTTVVFEHQGSSSNAANVVVDSEGDTYEIVFPVVTGSAAERRDLSLWHWRTWITPKNASKDDPTVPSKGAPAMMDVPGWVKDMSEDHHITGSTVPWSVGFAFRNMLLHRFDGGDFLLAEDPSVVSAGLPQWLDDELRCVICTDMYVNPHALNGCGHLFCHECVSTWLKKNNQCPICRHKLLVPTSKALTPCHMTQGLLDRYVLPYLPAKDVAALRDRARELRDNAAERSAAEARQANTSGGGRSNTANAAAAAAAATFATMITGGSGGGSIIRLGGAPPNFQAFQQMFNLHAQATAAARQGRQSGGGASANRRSSQPEDSSPIQLDISPMNEVSDTVQSVTGVLRNLMESRALFARVMAAGASMAENTPGDPTNASGAPTRRVEWNAVSSSIDRETLCARCNVAIPPRFLRLRRTETQIPRGGSPTMSRVFYHANFDCIRGMHDEIRAADNIDGLSELSDQERRVITALRSVIADPSAPLGGPTAS